MGRMNANDWLNMQPYFSTKEKWGDPFEMRTELMYELKAFREYIGKTITINCAYELTGHSADSQHKLGTAVDLSIEGLSLFEQLIAALKFNFKGIGVYPFWNIPGLHLDMRQGEQVRKFWWRDKSNKYYSFNKALFKLL